MTNGTQNLDNAHSGQITIGACYRLPDFEFYNADSLLKMQELKSETINCILIDPPYKYLKNQKLEVDFDETIFFNEAKRVLKNDGFIVMFGRGTSFYRWNTMLADLGFVFKEEFVWDKVYSSSPVTPISRFHETVSIHSKNNGILAQVKNEYIEMKLHDLDSIIMDIKRIQSCFKNQKSFESLVEYVNTGNIPSIRNQKQKNNVTVHGDVPDRDRGVNTFKKLCEGVRESSIMRVHRENYTGIHPTQKPVRLLERLLALTTKEGDLVLDAFAGSCSTGHACLNTKRKFIGYEIDHEYYEKAVERIKAVEPILFSGCL